MSSLTHLQKKKQVQARRITEELDACREEIFGSSDDDDEDPEMRRARRESVRSLQEEEERRRMQYEAAARGSQYEHGGGSSGLGAASLRRAVSQKQPRVREDPDIEEVEPPTHAPRRPDVVGPTDPFAYRKPTSKQPGIMKALKGKFGKAREHLVRATGKFFLHGGIPPNKASSPYFTTMLDAAAEHGTGIKAPTPYEIGHVCVEKEYEELQAWVQTFKWAWRERGCTLMCDGWTTITHRHLLNFLVYSSMGTVFIKSVDATDYIQDAKYINRLLNEVIEEIGADCVVQVVTDNAANMKAAGMLLMKQRPRIFWSPCAAHCLDLMLEDIAKGKVMVQVIGKIKKITNFFYQSYRLISMMKMYTDNHELLRPGITRFATHFIAIECVYKYRDGLLQLIKSQEFMNSKWGKRPSPITKEVCKTIESNKFWPHVKGVLNVFDPLIKVLRLVDGDDKPTMGFLHEAMERSKLAIQADCRYYKKYWKTIDDRWGRQLKHDLHSAGK